MSEKPITLVHPVTGLPREWAIEARSAGAPREGTRPTAPVSAAPVKRAGFDLARAITTPSLRDHTTGLVVQPVAPDRARLILTAALMGDLQSQWELFNLMEDGWDRLAKNLNEVKNAVRRLTWSVTAYSQRGEEPTPAAQEKADLVSRAMKNWEPSPDGLEYSFEDFLYNGLDALGKGISVQEICWHLRDGEWLPRAAHSLTPRQYAWNSQGNRLGLANGMPGGGTGPTGVRQAWMEFPRDKFVVGKWGARTGIPGGTALLRSLVPYWIGANYGYRWLCQTAQLFGVPFRWATYDPSRPEDAATLGTMLENLGSAGWAAFPSGTTLDFKEAVTSARDNPQAVIIEMGKKACDLLILGQELSSESAAAGLGSGTAMLQGGVRQEILIHAANWTAELINYQLIPALLRLNFGDTSEAPCIAPDFSTDPDPKTLAERDEILLRATDVQMPKAWFLERHGIPAAAENEETIGGRAANGNPNDEFRNPNRGTEGDLTEGNEEGEGEPAEAGTTYQRRLPTKHTECTKGDPIMAENRLVENVMEDVAGVEARWLAGVKPFFRELYLKAKDGTVTDADFVAAIEAAQKRMPELFEKMDVQTVAEALERAMGAACVNGAVQGFMKRKPRMNTNRHE